MNHAIKRESCFVPREGEEDDTIIGYKPCQTCSTGHLLHDAVESCLGSFNSNDISLFEKQYDHFGKNCPKCFLQPAITSAEFIKLCQDNPDKITQVNAHGDTLVDVIEDTIHQIESELYDEPNYLKQYETHMMESALAELKEMEKYISSIAPQYDNSNIFVQGGGLKLYFGIIEQLLDFVKDKPSALLRLYYDCAELAETDVLYADAQDQILHLLIDQLLSSPLVFQYKEIGYQHIVQLSPKEVALLYHALVIGHTFSRKEKRENTSYTRHMWFTHANFMADDGYIKKEEMIMIHLLEHALLNGHYDLIHFLLNFDALLIREFHLMYIYLKRNHHMNEHLYSDKDRAQPELLDIIRCEGSHSLQRLIKYAIAGVRQKLTDKPADFDNRVNPNLDVVKFLFPNGQSPTSHLQFEFESAEGLRKGNALEFWHAKENYTYTWYNGGELQFPYEKDEKIREYLEGLFSE